MNIINNINNQMDAILDALETKEVEGLSGKESYLANKEAEQEVVINKEDWDRTFGHDEQQDNDLAFS